MGGEAMTELWYAANATSTFDRPSVGALIALRHMALEVLDYQTRDDGSLAVLVRRIHGPKPDNENRRQEFGIHAVGRVMWRVYTDRRVPLCSDCGCPWPCPDVEDEKCAKQEMRHLADQLEKAHDGLCYSCGEYITARQASVIAPEPNVELPGFTAPRFHLRQKCRDGLLRYERMRRKAAGADYSPILNSVEEMLP